MASEYETLVEGDEDLVEGDEEMLVGDDEYGAAKRKPAPRKTVVQASKPGTQVVMFPLTACPVGTAVNIAAQCNRDCSALHLTAIGTIVATGVVSAGAQIVDLRMHGKTLFNSAGPVPAELFSPLAPVAGTGNCNFREVLKSGESFTLSMSTLAGGAATAVAANLVVRAFN